MKKNVFDRRIPTFFALLILLGGLSATLLLLKSGVLFISRASPNQDPQDVQIVNVSSTSFTVVFKTLDPTVAAVSLDGNPPSVYFDIRDSSSRKPFVSHFITVDKLAPETTYKFSVLSNGKTYLNNDNEFEAKTFQAVSSSSNNAILSGSVLLPDATAALDTLVSVSSENMQPIAAVTNDNGEFSVLDNLIRDASGQTSSLLPGQQLQLTIFHGNLMSKISYGYQQNGKIPLISLSNDYSFTAGSEEAEVGTSSSTLKLPTGTKQQNKIKINVPKDNDTFSDQRPQFQGVALPNSIVKITIHSPVAVQIQIRTDSNGNWSYRPGVALTVGPHTITIETVDATGALKTITSNFTVFASGSQVADTATPSATPTAILPTATSAPVPTTTPTATAVITPTPTLVAAVVTVTQTPSPTTADPTATPTILPSLTPTTAAAVTPVKNKVPDSGDITHTIFLTTTSILFIVAGSALFFIL